MVGFVNYVVACVYWLLEKKRWLDSQTNTKFTRFINKYKVLSMVWKTTKIAWLCYMLFLFLKLLYYILKFLIIGFFIGYIIYIVRLNLKSWLID